MVNIKKIISPKYDFMFKLCLGSQDKQKHLQNFLVSVLDLNVTNLVTKGQVELKKYFKNDKTGRLDIFAYDNNAIFIIEMQNYKTGMSCFRIMYYWSKAFLDQVLSNKNYTELLPCYAVLITDYTFDSSPNLVSNYSIKFDNFDLGCLKLFVVQLPKFNKETADLNCDKDLWLLFLTAKSTSDFDKIRGKNKYIDDCIKEVEKMSEEEELREIRRMHEKWDFERKLEKDFEFKKGLDKGVEKGIKKGVKKGIKQGIEKGEKNAQIEMVKKMYNLKTSIDFIKQVTGLSQKQIEEIIYGPNIGA